MARFCMNTAAWRVAPLLFLLAAMLVLSGCAGINKPYRTGGSGSAKPYTIRGKTYRPFTSAHGFTEVGVASWYGPGFHGKLTANGERYNQNSMTAAHKLLPFNTDIRVTNLDNGKSIVVRINDRGPFVDNRVIDLSRTGAEKIGMIGPGTARVRLEAVNAKAPILTPDGDMRGTFYIQVGAFRVRSNAQRLINTLKSMGLGGRLLPSSDGALLYVQAGPFPSVDRAEDILQTLQGRFPGLFVVAN